MKALYLLDDLMHNKTLNERVDAMYSVRYFNPYSGGWESIEEVFDLDPAEWLLWEAQYYPEPSGHMPLSTSYGGYQQQQDPVLAALSTPQKKRGIKMWLKKYGWILALAAGGVGSAATFRYAKGRWPLQKSKKAADTLEDLMSKYGQAYGEAATAIEKSKQAGLIARLIAALSHQPGNEDIRRELEHSYNVAQLNARVHELQGLRKGE